ncbi:MAG: hypothetical protein KatS3mg016_1204 [Fimbriimonadales bacterium]|nr:MAG: hypothetical protein KatS3mg016_1204 [Fimbriimonadales bacterium]GIV07850.1 MAG: hypothetical protein KatS3mg017_1052 [Fimbriimonadales bacterium]GIV10473.1 MAG: hypothetical protein KatS3mg019_2564 [Fimbriimonadales bacterium]
MARVDLERAAHALAQAPVVQVSIPPLPAQQAAMPADSASLDSMEAPPPAETLRRRRELALFSIEQQRNAVRQRLLQARLQNLSELERRWRVELRAEYDLDALRAEWDAQWREAFQEYGRRRFPLLVALIFTAPDSEARRQTQAELDALDRAWQAQEQALKTQYETQLRRIEQEITVRVNARRREFIRNADAEVREQLAQQPDGADLYLPQPQALPPAPPRKETLPSTAVQMPARDTNASVRTRYAQTETLRRQILSQLVQEWAQARGYRLTDDPNAPDRTDEFVRYLARR